MQQRHCISNVIHNTKLECMGATKQLYTATNVTSDSVALDKLLNSCAIT